VSHRVPYAAVQELVPLWRIALAFAFASIDYRAGVDWSLSYRVA
jgi:hypothetical protein